MVLIEASRKKKSAGPTKNPKARSELRGTEKGEEQLQIYAFCGKRIKSFSYNKFCHFPKSQAMSVLEDLHELDGLPFKTHTTPPAPNLP